MYSQLELDLKIEAIRHKLTAQTEVVPTSAELRRRKAEEKAARKAKLKQEKEERRRLKAESLKQKAGDGAKDKGKKMKGDAGRAVKKRQSADNPELIEELTFLSSGRSVMTKREKPLPKRELNLENKVLVKIDHKTWVYADPGADIEKIKAKYAQPRKLKDDDDRLPKYQF